MIEVDPAVVRGPQLYYRNVNKAIQIVDAALENIYRNDSPRGVFMNLRGRGNLAFPWRGAGHTQYSLGFAVVAAGVMMQLQGTSNAKSPTAAKVAKQFFKSIVNSEYGEEGLPDVKGLVVEHYIYGFVVTGRTVSGHWCYLVVHYGGDPVLKDYISYIISPDGRKVDEIDTYRFRPNESLKVIAGKAAFTSAEDYMEEFAKIARSKAPFSIRGLRANVTNVDYARSARGEPTLTYELSNGYTLSYVSNEPKIFLPNYVDAYVAGPESVETKVKPEEKFNAARINAYFV